MYKKTVIWLVLCLALSVNLHGQTMPTKKVRKEFIVLLENAESKKTRNLTKEEVQNLTKYYTFLKDNYDKKLPKYKSRYTSIYSKYTKYVKEQEIARRKKIESDYQLMTREILEMDTDDENLPSKLENYYSYRVKHNLQKNDTVEMTQGIVYVNQKKYNIAEDYIKKYGVIRGQLFRLQTLLDIYSNKKEWDKAVIYSDSLIALADENTKNKLINNKARFISEDYKKDLEQLKELANNDKEYIDYCIKSIKKHPDSVRLRMKLVYGYYNLKDITSFDKAYQTVIKNTSSKHEKYGYFIYITGVYYHELVAKSNNKELYNKCIEKLNRGIENKDILNDRRISTIYYTMGLIQGYLGNTKQAVDYHKKSYKIGYTGSCYELQKLTPEVIVGYDNCILCHDGTISYSKTRKGTCSHHGGVANWNYRRPLYGSKYNCN